MHVLWAIRWTITAQKEVTPQIIKSCFIKSTLFSVREGPLNRPHDYIDPPVLDKIQQIAEQLHAAGRFHNVINIRNFIKLSGEEVEDLAKDLIKHVAELYAGPDRDAETDEDDFIQPQIKVDEALQALQKLRLYEEQQEDGDTDLVTALTRHDRRIRGRRIRNTKQNSITAYFGIANCSILPSSIQIYNIII